MIRLHYILNHKGTRVEGLRSFVVANFTEALALLMHWNREPETWQHVPIFSETALTSGHGRALTSNGIRYWQED